MSRLSPIAYYLPQFHRIPENDAYWGEGFTEWRNVKSAAPLFKGHNQPAKPASPLGYYNPLDQGVLEQQVASAKATGISVFCFWHYHFSASKQTLYQVPEKFRADDLQMQYMYSWVNCDWTGSWVGRDDQIIFRQLYEPEDLQEIARYLYAAFSENRYYKKNGKPLLQIAYPNRLNIPLFLEIVEKQASEFALPMPSLVFPLIHTAPEQCRWCDSAGVEYFITSWPPAEGLGAMRWYRWKRRAQQRGLWRGPVSVNAEDFFAAQLALEGEALKHTCNYIPTLLTGWDNTPRYGRRGTVIREKPGDFETYCQAFGELAAKVGYDGEVFVKSWNEWAEGNAIEPSSTWPDRVNGLRRIF